MNKYLPYEKLSKKAKRKVDNARRVRWSDYGCLSPVSKIVPDKKKQAVKDRCRSNEEHRSTV